MKPFGIKGLTVRKGGTLGNVPKLLFLFIFVFFTELGFGMEKAPFLRRLRQRETPEFEKRQDTILNVPGKGLQPQPREYERLERLSWEEKYGDDMDSLKSNNPKLHYFLRFFNPPFLNKFPYILLTVMFALGTLFAMHAFAGKIKILLFILCLYCLVRIISFGIIFYFIAQGIFTY